MTELYIAEGKIAHEKLLSSILGREVPLAKGLYGKPRIDQGGTIHFNTTHTADRSFLLLADGETGIDAEEIGDYDEAILPLYFTHREIADFRALGGTRESFFKLWTLKESYLKYLGTGFSRSPLSVEVDLLDCSGFDPGKNCFFTHFIYDQRIAVSICQQNRGEIQWRILED